MVRVVVPAFLGLVLLVTVVVLVTATVTSRRPRSDAPARNPWRQPGPRHVPAAGGADRVDPAEGADEAHVGEAAGDGAEHAVPAGQDEHVHVGAEVLHRGHGRDSAELPSTSEASWEPIGFASASVPIPEQRLDLTAGAPRIDLTATDVLAEAVSADPPAP